MTRLTKAQLIAHIATLDAALLEANRDRDALRLRVSIAERNSNRKVYTPQPRVLPAHMAAARAMAIATGRVVKCGA